MKDFQPDSRPPEKQPWRFLSLILTVAVHVGLLAFLFFGVNWQSKPLGSLEVGLVGAPPAPSPEPPRPEPPKPPEPEPPKPEPPKLEPPKPEPPKSEPPKPEIATKAPDKPKQEKPKQEPPKPEKKREPAPLKPIDLKNQLNQAIERTAEAKKADSLLNAGQSNRSPNPGELDAYQNAIAAKVKRNLIAPPGLTGNPEAVFEIEQIRGSSGGEVVNVRLSRSSGNRALDEAIERAIRKSSPLPLPENPALFERRVRFTFRPLEE